jgi:hypothetical protein
MLKFLDSDKIWFHRQETEEKKAEKPVQRKIQTI